ncbi:MAG: Nudix family hydrolase [Burkholderiaceae bacterium]
MSARTAVDVAAGVLIRADGCVLLASRPAGKPYASYWEFPGGKVENNESILDALTRELHEELSIEVASAHPWLVRVFDYPHALVRLHFFRVFAWRGEIRAREHQDFGFFSPCRLPSGPLLPATLPVVKWLDLPPIYAVSAVAELGPTLFLQRLDAALERGLRWLQFREPLLHKDELASLFPQVLARVRAAGATLLVNSRHPRALWERADGVHLTAEDMARTNSRPEVPWVAASAHSSVEIERAASLGVDCVVVGPVQKTTTHPDRVPLGWIAFSETIAASPVPVYALGGLRLSDLTKAINCGAHGIAMMTGLWGNDHCFPMAGGRLDSLSLLSEWVSSEAVIE